MNSYTISNALSIGYQQLKTCTNNYKNETLWIMSKILDLDLSQLILNQSNTLSNQNYKLFLNSINRRKNSEPIQHILNSQSFYGYDFSIKKDVFIPRPETEISIDIIKKHIGHQEQILEIGCGSGCISIVLELEKLASHILSIDINHEAIGLAQLNAKKYNCNKIKFLNTDIFKMNHLNLYDMIISNPPYIPISEISKLSDEVKLYDPLSALTDYDDGLLFYRYFAKIGQYLLKKRGYMLLEFGGFNQIEELKIIFDYPNYNCTFFDDLNGAPRFILIELL